MRALIAGEQPDIIRRILRICLSLGFVGAITFVYFKVVSVNSTTVALTLLLAVLGIAARWGLLESLMASIAGMLCFNFFFLPPVGKWTIADPQNWAALFAFVVTAAVASQLSASATRRAAEATYRQHEMERLYELSRSLLSMDTRSPFSAQIAAHIAGVFGFQSVLFHDQANDQTYRLDPVEAGETTVALPLQLGGTKFGTLTLPRALASETALRAIAHLAALALDRARTQEAASRAEAARQSEELKTTLLDAFAHECKTPLTSIKAAVTTVLNENSIQPVHRELLQIVDEETDRLTSAVTDAIQMARIEAGQIELRKGPRSIADLIRQSLAKLAASLDARAVDVRVSEDLPPVAADPELVHIVIRQLLDNAVKYSPPDSPISIEASLEKEAVVVSVADCGPGVPEPDQNRVFEKFYRGREARERIPGTGMGLAIAREIVRAHNGDIRVEARSGQGSRFVFTLPVAREAARV
jgi:two-component system sensor histidine kinase KdpD